MKRLVRREAFDSWFICFALCSEWFVSINNGRGPSIDIVVVCDNKWKEIALCYWLAAYNQRIVMSWCDWTMNKIEHFTNCVKASHARTIYGEKSKTDSMQTRFSNKMPAQIQYIPGTNSSSDIWAENKTNALCSTSVPTMRASTSYQTWHTTTSTHTTYIHIKFINFCFHMQIWCGFYMINWRARLPFWNPSGCPFSSLSCRRLRIHNTNELRCCSEKSLRKHLPICHATVHKQSIYNGGTRSKREREKE